MTPSTTHITTSGGLISAAFIEAVREADARLPGLTPESFARPGGVWPSAAPPPSRAALEADIAAAWELLVERWDAVWDEIHTMDVSTVRQRWLLPLFEVLDFSPVYLRADVVLDDAGKLRYPLSHRGWDADREMGSAGAPYPTAPVLHTVAPAQKLDERMQGGRGVRVQSPHDTVQAFLNASSVDRWAVVTNGILLRLLREYHHTFTKGYIQFDLESMFETRNYGDFRALYRLCHASRFCPPFDSPPVGGKVGADEPAETDSGPSEAEEAPPSLTPLEAFYRNSLATGIKIGDDLRDQVREAIETLANGFLRTTPSLLQRLTSNQISNIQDPASNTRAFYAEILHIIYRILFLLFAEQRGMMPGRDSLYAETYAIARLRARAEGDILPLMTAQADLGYEAGFGYTDLWEGLKVTFRMVREGCPPLGVFGYDGMLFADDQTPLLAPPSAIRNSDLLHAIRALTLVEREGVLQRISYADLGVEELGSIYESLLDYTPRVTARAESVGGREVPARTFVLDPVGSERKTTGSYYTDDSLVNQLIKTALLPVMHDRLARAGLPVIPPNEIGETGGGLLADYAGLDAARRADGAAALLDLKVCDPAVGSGHFLVKANNMLGAELARVRTGEPYPVEDAVQAARRDVLAHCIYGVDLNPMAVELCKVSLWINASVRDQPLNFLDHHVRCGNSLVGATPELVRDGIAYEAFALGRAGDDREIAKAVRAQNRRERAEFEKGGGVQLSMFQVTRVFEPPDTGAWRSLTELAEVNPQAARERFAAYQSDAATAKARLLADTWTAAFFWPLTPEAPPPPTFSAFRELLALGKDGLTEAQQRMVAALAEKHRFFHWHLAFPDVFEGEAEGGQGGFDVVLGNPPWERIKLQEKEFFAGRAPAIEAARTASERGKLVRQLPRTDPALHRAYVDALHASEALSGFLRNSGRYPLSASGDINTYQIFAGLVRQIVDGRGRVGIVLPTGIATDYYNQDYFAALVENRELVSLYDFENRAKLFPEVDSRFKFSLVTLTGMAAPVEAAEYAFFLHQVDDLAEAERKFALTSADLARINPNTRTCPVFRTRRDAELTAKLYRAAPVLVNETTGENPWGVSFSTMFHMTNDSHLFCTREELVARGAKLHGNVFVGNGDEYLPLYEAKMFWHIDHRFGSYEGNDSRSDVHLTIPTPDQYRSPEYQVRPWYWVRRMDVVERSPSDLSWFLAFRDITNTTNERTGVFTLLPWSGLSNKAPVLIPRVDFPNIISGFLANLDALVFDFCIRQKMGGTSLNFYIVKQLPVLPPETYSSDLLRFIIPRVLELTYTAWDLRAFADDVWAEAGAGLREAVTAQWEANAAATGGGHRDAVAPDWAPAPGPDPFPCPPFMWDEARRALLRAELDGLYAHLYGLTREELAYILDTFPIVRRKDEARYGEFRTKRLVLAAYEEVKSDP